MTMVPAYPVAPTGGDRSAAGAAPARHRPRSKKLGLRLHEALLGRRTLAIAEMLAASERLPREELAALQLRKLQRLLGHAGAHCPYYHRRGLPPDVAIRRLGDISKIPLLTREEVRRFAGQMCWSGMTGHKLSGRTHGTSDEPLQFFWDRRRQAWDKANRMRGHRWHGFGIGDRELHVWPLDPPRSGLARFKQRLREHRDRWQGEQQIDSLRVFDQPVSRCWEAWRRFDPVRVTVYPSVLTQLIEEGRATRYPIGNASLACVFLTGEVTFPWQREIIERELGVATAQDYGVQEVGPLAYSCRHGRWHVCAESVIVEIIRHGRPAQPGELGEIVVTGLESFAMPMLRYCTGDIAQTLDSWSELEGRQCSCGLSLPMLPPVLGRSGDFLESSDGRWIEPAEVLGVVGQVLGHNSFQIVQAKDGSITVRIVDAGSPSSHYRDPAWDAAIRERIGRLLGPAARCSITSTPALSRSLYGKCRYVASERTVGGLACC